MRLFINLDSIFHQLQLIILLLLKLRLKKMMPNLFIEHPSELKKLYLKIQLLYKNYKMMPYQQLQNQMVQLVTMLM